MKLQKIMDKPAVARLRVEDLIKKISAEYANLSPGLQRIAKYVEKHADHLGLDKINDIAKACDIKPSAVVRFAKHFGFDGYSDMQLLFKHEMSAQIAYQRNYQARIREVINRNDQKLSTQDIAQSNFEGSIASMQSLQKQLHSSDDLNQAVQCLLSAPSIWIIGTNRAFPAASYLAYLLQHTEKPVHFMYPIGLGHSLELRALKTDDVMLAISFSPYGHETLQAVETAKEKGAKIIALTDSRLSPLSKSASVSLIVSENSVLGFRSLTNTMLIIQSLFVAMAYHLEIKYKPNSST